nr:uncharacterized protein LOC104649754 [Solanum lycopersicum]
MLKKMSRRFDVSNDQAKELRGCLANIEQKVDAHAVSIKHLELQMDQLSTTMNPRQTDTLPRNTIQNPKNYGHCMEVTTQGGKQTIDPPMPYVVENEMRKDEEVVETSGELVDKVVKEAEIPQKVIPITSPPPTFPQRLVKKTKDGYGYKEEIVSFEDDDRMQHCTVISTRSLVQKKKDLGAFTISCAIGLLHFAKALCDLGACINLMPLSIYQKFGLSNSKTTTMRLLMVNQTVKRPIRILNDVLINEESFILPTDFVILDCEVDFEVNTILGRSKKQSGEFQTVHVISYRVESRSEIYIEEHLGVKALATMIMNFESYGTEEYGSLVAALEQGEYRSKPKKLELDMKHRESPSARPYIEEVFKLELKPLPPHLRLEDEAMRDLDEKGEIDDTIPDEQYWLLPQDIIPWFADFVNYVASDIVPSNLSFHQRKKFMNDVKKFFWDEPY